MPEKNVPFYAYWASKYLAFLNKKEKVDPELNIPEFLDILKKKENIADWQVRQVYDAIQLYVNQFLDAGVSTSHHIQPQETKNLSSIPKIIEEMRETLRIKHYAYRTELSYIDWTDSGMCSR